MKEQRVVLDSLDERIARLAEQVGALMERHQQLVKEGKLPAYKLMGGVTLLST